MRIGDITRIIAEYAHDEKCLLAGYNARIWYDGEFTVIDDIKREAALLRLRPHCPFVAVELGQFSELGYLFMIEIVTPTYYDRMKCFIYSGSSSETCNDGTGEWTITVNGHEMVTQKVLELLRGVIAGDTSMFYWLGTSSTRPNPTWFESFRKQKDGVCKLMCDAIIQWINHVGAPTTTPATTPAPATKRPCTKK